MSIAELEQAFAQDPQSTAYLPLGEAYLEQGRFMEALVVGKKGLKAHPTALEPRLLLAKVYAKQDKHPRALEELAEAVKAHPNAPDAYVARARVRKASGDAAGSLDDLKKAVDLQKDHAEAQRMLGELGVEYPERPKAPPPPPPVAPPPMAPRPAAALPLEGGDVHAATPPPLPAAGLAEAAPRTAAGRRVVKHKLEGEDALEKLAASYADTQQAPKPGNAKLSIALGAALLVIGGGALGFQLHRKSVREGIDRHLTAAKAVFLEDTYGGYKKAVLEYQAILDNYDAKHEIALSRLVFACAVLYGEHGDTDCKAVVDKQLPKAEKHAAKRAETIAAKGLAILYESPNRLETAAKAYEAIGKPAKALRENLGPGSAADLALGIIDLELGNYDSALEGLDAARQNIASGARAHVWYARAALRAGQPAAADAAFAQAVKLSSDHSGARAGRALVRIRRGNLEGAADDILKFDEFKKSRPKEVSALDEALIEYARSEVFRAAGDEARADFAYERAVQADPRNADFPYGRGRSLLERGRAKDALEPLKKALEMEPNRIAFQVGLAQAYTELGSYGEAQRLLDKVLAEQPKNLDASVAKAQLLAKTDRGVAERTFKEILEWSEGRLRPKLAFAQFYRSNNQIAEARALLEPTIEAMGSYPQSTQAEVLLEYGLLMAAVGEEQIALNSFEQAAGLGEGDGWFRMAEVLARRDRRRAKEACGKYLGAGTAQRHFVAAQALCQGL